MSSTWFQWWCNNFLTTGLVSKKQPRNVYFRQLYRRFMAQIEVHSFTTYLTGLVAGFIIYTPWAIFYLISLFCLICSPFLLCVCICMQVLHSQGLRVGWGLVVWLQQPWVCKLFKDWSSLQGAEPPLLYSPCSITHAMPKTHLLIWVNTNFLLSARSKWD